MDFFPKKLKFEPFTFIGRITLEKCKKAREVKEEAKELAELDTTNIIKEGTVCM